MKDKNYELIVKQVLASLNTEQEKYGLIELRVLEAGYKNILDDKILLIGIKEELKDIRSGTYFEIDVMYKILAALMGTPVLIATNYPNKRNIFPKQLLDGIKEEDLEKTYFIGGLDYIKELDYKEALLEMAEKEMKLEKRYRRRR